MSENYLDSDEKTTKKAPAADVVDNLAATCNEIAQEYINNLDDPDEIKQNNGLFVGMLKYIYKCYLGDIIGNKDNTYIHYDYELLDRIFYIYSDLVYKYKQNKRCSILEYSLFIQIDRQTLYNAINGHTKKLSPSEVYKVKNWFTECENTLTNGNGVFEIFLLKSQYRYNDNLAPIPITDQGPALAVNELPDLGTDKPALSDSKTDPKKTGKKP